MPNQQPRTFHHTITESRTDRSSPVQCIWHINPSQTKKQTENATQGSKGVWSSSVPTAADFQPIIPTEECHPLIKNARNPFFSSPTDKNHVQTESRRSPLNSDGHRRFCITQTPKTPSLTEKQNYLAKQTCTTAKQSKFDSFPRKRDQNRVSASFSSLPRNKSSINEGQAVDKSMEAMRFEVQITILQRLRLRKTRAGA